MRMLAETTKRATQKPAGWAGNEISGGVFNNADPGNHPDLTMEQWLGDISTTGISEQMLTDPEIAASYKEWVEWAKNSNWTVEPADPADPVSRMQAEFVRRNFWEISETRWSQILENALWQLIAGCALAEPVYRWDANDRTPSFELIKKPGRLPKWEKDGTFDTGHNVLDDLATRLPRSIMQWIQDPITGKFAGIRQYARQDDVTKKEMPDTIEVPADKLVLWTFNGKGNHWAGEGLFRSAYFIWRARQTLLRTGVISFERFGVGVPVATANMEAFDALSKGERTDGWNDLMTQLSRYRGGSQAWLAPMPGFGVDLKEGAFNSAAGILDLYNALTIEIHTIGGTHHLIQGSQKVGTLDLVSEQSSDFRSTIMPTFRDAADVLNRGPVRDLIDLNWAGVDAYPEITPSDLETVDVKKSLDAYEVGVRAQAITPQPEDEEHFRERAGWPQRVELAEEEEIVEPDEDEPQEDPVEADESDDEQEDIDASECPCGCQGVEILAESTPMLPDDASPARKIRALAEAQHDGRASRISREDIVKRTAIQVHAMLGPKVLDPYLDKIAPLIEAGDALAISKTPLPGKAAIQRRLVRDYQDVRALAKSEVKREIKRGKDEDIQAALDEALMELRQGTDLFAENPSGLENAIDAVVRSTKAIVDRIKLAASTTASFILESLNKAMNDYFQQTPATDWSAEAAKDRGLSIVTPRTMAKDITQDTNTTYMLGRAEQGRIQGAGIVVYTVNPEIGISGPHEVCVECQTTADSADNPALVGSPAEERLVTPNPACLSTLSGVNTCWCSNVFLTTTNIDEAARAAGLA